MPFGSPHLVALRAAVLGMFGFLFAQLAALALVMTLRLATEGDAYALFFLVPYLAGLYLSVFAAREVVAAVRGG